MEPLGTVERVTNVSPQPQVTFCFTILRMNFLLHGLYLPKLTVSWVELLRIREPACEPLSLTDNSAFTSRSNDGLLYLHEEFHVRFSALHSFKEQLQRLLSIEGMKNAAQFPDNVEFFSAHENFFFTGT